MGWSMNHTSHVFGEIHLPNNSVSIIYTDGKNKANLIIVQAERVDV